MSTDVNPAPVSAGAQPEVPPVVPPVVPAPSTSTPPPAPAPAPAAPGSQTDPVLLLKSLKEEREKRQELQTQLDALMADPGSEEGRILKSQIDQLNARIVGMEQGQALKDLHAQYPALVDKSAEFEAYRADPANAGMSMATAAKAFLTENGLLRSAPRKGLEQPTGGGRQNTPVSMTADDVAKLRTTNYRDYSRRLRAGEFKDIA